MPTYEEARSQGLCYQCRRRAPLPGKTRCGPCREQQRAAYRRRAQDPEWVSGNRAKVSAWQKANPERKAQHHREHRQRLRQAALDHYGHRCSCCSEAHDAFLTIDHVSGGGRQHRLLIGQGSGEFYRWLRRNGYPEDFQTLCFNCNCAKGIYGHCPHEAEATA
jgi:hypothetical protein